METSTVRAVAVVRRPAASKSPSPYSCVGRFLLALALCAFALPRFAPLSALDLQLSAGESGGAPIALAVGDSLVIAAKGLAPGAAVDLELRSPTGARLAFVRARADDFGAVPPALVWFRTGVLGCDPDPGAVGYRTFDEAEAALVGRVVSAVLVEPAGGEIVAERAVELVRTAAVQAYWSDASGCPRRAFSSGEDAFVALRGPKLPREVRLFVIADRPTWLDPVPLVEVRTAVGAGGAVYADLPELSAGLAVVRAWEAERDDPRCGLYAAVVRTDPSNASPWLSRTDRVLGHGAPGSWRSTEEGVAITDWPCRN